MWDFFKGQKCIQTSDPAFKVEISFRAYPVKFKDIAVCIASSANRYAVFICGIFKLLVLSHQAHIGTVTDWVAPPQPETAIVLRPAGPPATITITSSTLRGEISPVWEVSILVCSHTYS